MFERGDVLEIEPSMTDHVVVRGKIRAKMAIVYVSGLTIFESRGGREHEFAVATKDGMFFRIEVLPYSTNEVGAGCVEAVPELRCCVAARDVNRARRSRSPLILFLMDAETTHGRFARLDVLPAPPRGAKTVQIGFPLANVITPASVSRLVAELEEIHTETRRARR